MKWFRLYSDMVPVKGCDGCTLYDFRENRLYKLDHETYQFLELAKKANIGELGRLFGSSNALGLINELCTKYIGFITSEPERYQDLPLEWQCSSLIRQAVMEYSGKSYCFGNAVAQLDEMLCEYLELRIHITKTDIGFIERCLDTLDGSTCRSVHLVLDYDVIANPLSRFIERYSQLTAISLYKAPNNGKVVQDGVRIVYYKQGIDNLDRRLPKMPLIVKKPFFCEAHRFNPYFNRKVVIDRNGFLKNDLRQQCHFGNITNTPLKELISDNTFTELWHTRPDSVLSLRDDSMRYARLIPDLPIKNTKGHLIYL